MRNVICERAHDTWKSIHLWQSHACPFTRNPANKFPISYFWPDPMLFLQYTYHGIPVDVQQRTVIYK